MCVQFVVKLCVWLQWNAELDWQRSSRAAETWAWKQSWLSDVDKATRSHGVRRGAQQTRNCPCMHCYIYFSNWLQFVLRFESHYNGYSVHSIRSQLADQENIRSSANIMGTVSIPSGVSWRIKKIWDPQPT